MLSKIEIRWIWLISALFIATNAVFILFEQYWFSAIPIVLALLLMTVMSLQKTFWFIVVATPLSINFEKLELGGIGMFIPTEPLLFFIMILFFVRMFLSFDYDKKILYHPITLAIIFQVIWLIITSFTSVSPIVSLKFVVARIWFLVTFYFIAIQIFKDKKTIGTFFWLFLLPMLVVIVYTVINHALHDFGDKPAHFVMQPFFKDHTSYGAILVMYFPILIYLIYSYQKMGLKIYSMLALLIFSIGIVFSYTRAAWVSLAGALLLWGIYKLKIKFRYVLSLILIVFFTIFTFWTEIMMSLEKNRKESSSNLSEHVQSISNISSDASNLERINRWESAWRMFLEKPVFGFGPGTYMFEYAPFQHSQSLTIISTNAGKMGNAHSEYIGPLAESGLIGCLSFILIIILVYYYGSRLYHKLPRGKDKALILAVLLGFSTYAAHGLLNNYLDTDKASLPFWGFIAILVVYDVYHKNSLEMDSE